MSSRIGRSLPLALVVALAGPAPADEPKPKAVAGGAEFVDPDGDCKFREEKGKWVLEVPGAYHDLWPKVGKVNAPRVLKDAGGDFRAEVKVPGPVAAQPGTALPGLATTAAFRAASLLVWQDENTFVRLDRAGMATKDGKRSTYCYYQAFKDGERVVHLSYALRDREALLRLERKGGKVYASVSQDGGKNWHAFPPQAVELAGKLKAGVAALNTTTQPLAAEFEGLTVSPVKD